MTLHKEIAETRISRTEHAFAQYIRILGKGKTGTRSLDQREAQQAFTMILRGEAEPLQIGAFLMLLRVKEESPDELAGFVLACRENMVSPPHALSCSLDWAAYAGKKHQHPWLMLSALLLAEAGHRIFIHGTTGHTVGRLYIEDAMRQLGLPVATNWTEVSLQLDQAGLSYLPLEHFCPALEALMQLRPLLGLRSPVNTLSRLINPLNANASLQSIFHPAYARLHQDADCLLQQPRAVVFKGESGEVEIKPHADTRIHILESGECREILLPRVLPQRVESVDTPRVEPLRELWRGTLTDEYGLAATLATAAIGLFSLTPGLSIASAQQQAVALWKNRNTARLD